MEKWRNLRYYGKGAKLEVFIKGRESGVMINFEGVSQSGLLVGKNQAGECEIIDLCSVERITLRGDFADIVLNTN